MAVEFKPLRRGLRKVQKTTQWREQDWTVLELLADRNHEGNISAVIREGTRRYAEAEGIRWPD